MSWLLDVNLLLACAWRSHANHAAANIWLDRQSVFFTCPLTELGMVRVSMSPGFRATFADALAALTAIKGLRAAHFAQDELPATRLPPVTSYADVMDAHLVALASLHKWKLATLDDALCKRSWAAGVAINPLRAAKTKIP